MSVDCNCVFCGKETEMEYVAREPRPNECVCVDCFKKGFRVRVSYEQYNVNDLNWKKSIRCDFCKCDLGLSDIRKSLYDYKVFELLGIKDYCIEYREIDNVIDYKSYFFCGDCGRILNYTEEHIVDVFGESKEFEKK